MTLDSTHVRLTRRNLLRVGAASGAAVIAAACGAPAASTPTSAPAGAPASATTAAQAGAAAGGKAVELEIWTHSDVLVDWMSDAMKNFNFPNQNITLKKVVYPIAEVHAKMLAALSSGQGVPDIMRIEQGRFSPFIKGSTIGLTDLTDKIGDRTKDLVLGSAVDYWSWKNKIYGIGNELNVVTLAYRTDMFEGAGAKVPFDSWDDFRKAGLDLKAKQSVLATVWHDQSEGDFQNLLFASGGVYLDENGDFAGDTDTGVQIMQMFHEHIYKDKIASVAAVTGDSTWSPPIFWAGFKENKIASTMGAVWHNGNLGQDAKIGPDQSGKWRLQRIPKGFGANKPTSTQGGTSASIPLKSPHPEESWQVIEFTHLTKAVMQDFDNRGVMVTYKPALSDERFKKPWDYYGGQKIGEIFSQLAQDMPRIQQSPWKPEIDKAFRDIVATPILGNENATAADIKSAFVQMKAEIERIKKL